MAKLEADPNTDWWSVKVVALRNHLVDMDRLVRGTVVMIEERSNGATFTIGGNGSARDAAGRMVPAHTSMLKSARPWTFAVSLHDAHLKLDVSANSQEEVQKIKALEDHHRMHYWALVNGRPMH